MIVWKEGTLVRNNLRINKYFLLVAFFAALGSFSCGKTASQAVRYSIAVIPKGTTHEFWKAIHAGAVKAEQELSGPDLQVSITWKGPLREDDREQQIQVVEGFLSQGVNGIVLAPLDNRALVRPVEEAAGAGIPTVIIDSALDSSKIISFVATDNLKGGSEIENTQGAVDLFGLVGQFLRPSTPAPGTPPAAAPAQPGPAPSTAPDAAKAGAGA